MAWELVEEVLDHAPPMTPAEGLVLVAIAEETRTAGTVCEIPSEVMVRRTRGMTPSGIRKALSRLSDRGIEVRVPIGTGVDGRPLYAVPSKVPKYRLPRFSAPQGCVCDRCNRPRSAKAGPQSPLAGKPQVTKGGTTVPPSGQGGTTGTPGGTTGTEGGTTGTPGGTTVPPLPSFPDPSFSPDAAGPAHEERETDPLTRKLMGTYGATADEVRAVLADAERDGVRSLTGWAHSPTGRADFTRRLTEQRDRAARRSAAHDRADTDRAALEACRWCDDYGWTEGRDGRSHRCDHAAPPAEVAS